MRETGLRPWLPVIFLDRDGTLIRDRGHLADPARVELLPGVGEALALLNRHGFPVAVVTNQSGIGRGWITLKDYLRVEAALEQTLADMGARVDVTMFCPDPPGVTSTRRKPAAGMFLEAAQALGRTPQGGVFVGDRLRDVEAARLFGGEGWLLATGHPAERPPAPWIRRAPSLVEVVTSVVERYVEGKGSR